jgi:HD-GYP domain-containing protein (c-di-GMP phosphodiesterase class II)
MTEANILPLSDHLVEPALGEQGYRLPQSALLHCNRQDATDRSNQNLLDQPHQLATVNLIESGSPDCESRILIVDDESGIRNLFADWLSENYQCETAASATKPWNNDDLKLTINRACEHYESNKRSSALTLANDRLLARLQEIKANVVSALSDMSKARDEYAYDHAVRVGNYATSIAQRIGLSAIEIEALASAAMLHDLAEVDSSNTASRASSFANALTTLSLAHLECEAKLLGAIPELAMVTETIKFQRENFDGLRSPEGLSGEQIPLASRILRVAREFDSLVQPKAPAASMRADEAMRFLSQRAGKQFDPKIIQIMSQLSENDLPQGFLTSIDSSNARDAHAPSFDAAFS